MEAKERFSALEGRKQVFLPDVETDFNDNYIPGEDEPYMNPRQVEYFRLKLLTWRERLLRESGEAMEQLKQERNREIDFVDQGAEETFFGVALKTRDRSRKLIRKIDDALMRIQDGTYGYCEETKKEIGIRRLEARPIATLCIEAQRRHELMEKRKRAGY